MNQIDFSVLESPSSNDHEVRILIDGQDWLDDQDSGVDPPDFFARANAQENGCLLVGRCGCGCEGCSDTWVDVTWEPNTVHWKNHKGLHLTFDRNQYTSAISQASNDTSWENAQRTAERLINALLAGLVIEDGFIFHWASARIRPEVVELCFINQGASKMFEMSWNQDEPATALESAKRFLADING
jgi:hypothetical protein